jgi:hypothetical protein
VFKGTTPAISQRILAENSTPPSTVANPLHRKRSSKDDVRRFLSRSFLKGIIERAGVPSLGRTRKLSRMYTRVCGMSDKHLPLKSLEEIEGEVLYNLLEVLRQEGLDVVRHVLWDATGRRRNYDPQARRNRAAEEQKRLDWETTLRIEKILSTVLHETHERQVEEVMEKLSERPEGFYR